MADGLCHLSLFRKGLGLLLGIMSLAVIADPVNQEPASPSFYGHRAITQDAVEDAPPKIEFQRRAIAPPIAPIESHVESLTPALSNTQPHTTDHVPSHPLSNHVLTLIDETIPLSRDELLLAKKAQYYIDRNWQEETGFINSVQGYPHSTMWDIASGLSAILSLEGLGLYSTEETELKIQRTLDTLSSLVLYDNRLPNREYSTHTAQPSGSMSQTAQKGNGWSALDIGRLLIWLEITARHKPQLKSDITTILTRWQLDDAVHQQTLYGEKNTSYKRFYRQEGRLGYLQYTAHGFDMAGFDVRKAFADEPTTTAQLNGHTLYIDTRNLPYFTSDPYVLHAIELGRTDAWWDQLDTLFTLHKKQSQSEKALWIFAEDALNQAPWFSYNNIFIYGRAWVSTAPGGKPIENPQIFSNKMALGFSVLFPEDPFGQQLHQQVIDNSLPYRAIPTGVLRDAAPNLAFNINTNAFILSALWYKHRAYQPLILAP
ncbi:DUF3131 domain-containing protein [Photobacterium japonica]|uniref:DUF3131 domain-containing protein n=1 Tax=Photobacterium japonica TaxID=2910235 RepID=UPI003D1248C8